MIQLNLPLFGLNCMGCANKLNTQLHEDFTIKIESITPTQLSCTIEATLEQLLDSVESLGYLGGNEWHFELSGLSCQRCVQKLQQHLAQNPYIARVHLTQYQLSLRTSLDANAIITLIAELGYQANLVTEPTANIKPISHTNASSTQPISESSAQESIAVSPQLISTHLLIQGMTCASCVASVEKALMQVDGVEKAQINLAENSALVLSQQDNTAALLQAIQTAGYQAQYVEDPQTQQAQQQAQLALTQALHQKNATLGLLVGAPLMLWGTLGGNMMIRHSGDQYAWGAIGVLCLALLLTAGRGFFIQAWQALTHKRATMDTLVALGTGAAWFYSMLVVLFPSWFPDAARHVYFEATAMILGLISLGHYIEAKAKAKTTQSLQALINLQPQTATLISPAGEQVIALSQVQQGMLLRIKPGERIPVDGKITEGQSYLDESMLTGEPMPINKTQGDAVSAGTINQDGSLIIQATGIGEQTMLSRIIQLVRQAQSSKPKIAQLADQISAVFVPVVVMIALIAAGVWFWFGPEPKASYMLVIATTVLIIACPCALGLATPLSVTVGVGKAAELGILIRDADVLQSASTIDTVVFDKTGTLTEGKPQVQEWVCFHENNALLQGLAFALEQRSEHPLAKAIIQDLQTKTINDYPITEFKNLRGQGLEAHYQNQKVQIGSPDYLQSTGVALHPAQEKLTHFAQQAWTPVAIALDGKLLGLVAIADAIKPSALRAIQALNERQIHTVMLTGDHQSVAQAIASQLGIAQVISQVLPDAKAEHIAALQQQGKRVAMVGDGINDAPALAQADIGIAMGSGSDVAIESAQITLLNSSPLAVVNAIELSKATLRNMKQNLFGAFIYNSLGIPIAAGLLYPFFGFLLSPVVAGAAMALSSITVVTNANRLRLTRLPFSSSH